MLPRRTLLTGLAAAALAPQLPARAATADPWQAGFAAARAADPRFAAFDAAPLEGYRTDRVALTGRIPDGLRGVLLRNGPAGHEVGGARYHHWFDGDGMVQRFGIGPDGVSHRGRYVQTPKFVAERAAGRMLQRAFATTPAGTPPPARADDINPANISMLLHGGKTMALWEGGSATEIDPDDLATRGFVRFSADSEGLPFSAHPRRDADGSLWNIGQLPGSGKLAVWHLAADGTLASLDLLPAPADAGMMHDFVLTERHLLVPLPSLALGPAWRSDERATLLDSYQWRPQQPFRLLAIAKADRTISRSIELPPGFVFHFGNGWEDAAGVVRVEACWYADPSLILDGFRAAMRGAWHPGTPAEARLLTIDLARGVADFETIAPAAEFPRFDERHAARRSRASFMVAHAVPALASGALQASVLRWDRDTGAQDRYAYPLGVLAEEHIFVPRPSGAEGEGWLLGTSLDTATLRTHLAVFEATRLADGPLALATLPYALPLGLHGAWRADS